jgi:CRISPR-associated protein Cpf1
MDKFTNLYSLSKTLRFELKPVGKTLENIQKIIDEDKKLNDDSKKVKKLIDEYHKSFIEKTLGKFKFSNEGRDDLKNYYSLAIKDKKNDTEKDEIKKLQEKLRKEIKTAFEKEEEYKKLFKKELIKEDLPRFIEDESSNLSQFYERENITKEEIKKLLEKFQKFTTYFVKFNQNRKNMYSDKVRVTAISHRLINENLPKFIQNIFVFEKIKQYIKEDINKEYLDLKKYINVNKISDIFNIGYYENTLTQKQIDTYNMVIGGLDENGEKIKGLNEYINLYSQKNKNIKLLGQSRFIQLFKQILSDRNEKET